MPSRLPLVKILSPAATWLFQLPWLLLHSSDALQGDCDRLAAALGAALPGHCHPPQL